MFSSHNLFLIILVINILILGLSNDNGRMLISSNNDIYKFPSMNQKI